jgi:hypothetical protein
MTEKCGRCERPAPPPIEGPDGQVEQGWVTYEGARELVVAVPDDSSLLPPNVVATMRAFEGELIRIAPLARLDSRRRPGGQLVLHRDRLPGLSARDGLGLCRVVLALRAAGEAAIRGVGSAACPTSAGA